MNFFLKGFVIIGLVASGSAYTAGSSSMAAATGNTLTGSVKFTKKAPKEMPIKMNADPVCAKAYATPPKKDDVVVNGNGTLKNVFVYVSKGVDTSKVAKAKDKVVLDQKGCLYDPRILGVQTGQTIEILNSDPTMHNVHSLAKKNKSDNFNVAMATKGQKIEKSFKKPETMVKVKCDVHGWMASYIGVLDHPYFAVTDDQGNFTIKDLPPGNYTVTAWHEKYKTADQQVNFTGSEKVEFSF